MPAQGMTRGDVAVKRNQFKAPAREPAVVGDTGLFGEVDPAIQNMISGESFGATEEALTSAQGRMERTQRAGAARGLGAFATQGAGQQIAQGVEGALGQSRLQNIFNIGQGRQAAQERGVQTQLARVGQEESIRQGRDQIQLGRDTLDLSRLDSDRRNKLSTDALALQDKIQSGQLSIQETTLELQRLLQEANIDLGRSAENRARFPIELQRESLLADQRLRQRISPTIDQARIPEFR